MPRMCDGDISTRDGILDAIKTWGQLYEGHKMVYNILCDAKANHPDIYDAVMTDIESAHLEDVIELRDYVDLLVCQLLID